MKEDKNKEKGGNGGHFTGNVKFPNTNYTFCFIKRGFPYMHATSGLPAPHFLFLLEKWI